MPLTNNGYERPTYDDIVEVQIDRAKQLFGEDIDTNENTPLGKYIRLNCADLAEIYEILEMIYYARFPNTAKGVSLDRLCPFVGITRNQATYAKHEVKFTGEAGEYVPEAFEVSAGDILFHTYNRVQLGEDGTATAVVECETAGTVGNVTIGSIDTIVNPDTNVESVEHISVLEYAEDLESDTDLRYRFNKALSNAGAATTKAIAAAITSVPLVDGVEIIENNTDKEVNGLPPHTFACYVLAPETQYPLIAEAIFSKKPTGIISVGDISVDIVDEYGESQTVSFYETNILYPKIYIEIFTDSNYKTDGINQIKQNIINYINGLKIGEDVYISKLIASASNVAGVNAKSAYINCSSYGDFTVESNEVARVILDYVYVGIYNDDWDLIGGDDWDEYEKLVEESE